MKFRFLDISKKGITKTSLLINKKSVKKEFEEIHFNYVIGIFSATKKNEKNVFHVLQESSIYYKFHTFMDIDESFDLYCRFRAGLKYYIELFDFYNNYENILDFYKYNQDEVEKIKNKVYSMVIKPYLEDVDEK